METSGLMWLIHADENLRQRIEALVREHWWGDAADDPRAQLDVTAIAWAVATNTTIRNGVADRITAGDTPAEAVNEIADLDLAFVVLTVALPRLEAALPGE